MRWPRWGLGKWNIPRGLLPCWSTHQQCGPGAKPRVKVKELSAAQNLKHVVLVKGSLLLRSTFFQSPLDQNLVGFGERGRSKSMRKGLNCARICFFFLSIMQSIWNVKSVQNNFEKNKKKSCQCFAIANNRLNFKLHFLRKKCFREGCSVHKLFLHQNLCVLMPCGK